MQSVTYYPIRNIKSESDKESTLNAQTVFSQICIFALY